MTYEEIKAKVTSILYVPVKKEGAAAHPDWYGIGCNPSTMDPDKYARQLDLYIADVYGVKR